MNRLSIQLLTGMLFMAPAYAQEYFHTPKPCKTPASELLDRHPGVRRDRQLRSRRNQPERAGNRRSQDKELFKRLKRLNNNLKHKPARRAAEN